MNKHARQVITQIKKLDRPPFMVEITVESYEGCGVGYATIPSTNINYKIRASFPDSRTIGKELRVFSADEEGREEAISTAKNIATVVSENYEPRGYEKKFDEITYGIDTDVATTQIYSTRIILSSKKRSSFK